MEKKTKQRPKCNLCGGTKCLRQVGIARVYLLPHTFSLILMVAGAVAGVVWSRLAFLLVAVGFLIPLANADLRLLLYPIVALCGLLGKKPNCPKCEPSGGVFRRSAVRP